MSILKNANTHLTPREELENKFKSSRSNLLFAVIITAVNLFLLLIGTDLYFLFSITTPYLLVSTAMYLCGMFPAEYYVDLPDGSEFFDTSVFIVLLTISLVLLSFYFITWLFSSKRKTVLLVIALVLFIGDTLLALAFYGLSVDCLVEMLFHAWILYYLINGIIASRKLNSLPPEEAEATAEESVASESSDTESSPHLRVADMSVKYRVLAEVSSDATPFNKAVCYRRVGKVNELVVGDYVYDEYEATVEIPHTLTATIDSHKVEASLDSLSRSIIKIDGEIVVKKMRLI